MTTAIRRRRGTTTQHATFTGLEGEVTVDTTKDTLVVHDGSTAGGHPLAKENNATLTGNVTVSGGTANGVAYLNGSKVLTTGSALTFDGTNLTLGGYGRTSGTGWQVLNNGLLTTFGANAAGTVINNHDGGPLQFQISSSEQMRLTSTGLGIGTSSPGAKLHVAGEQLIQPTTVANAKLSMRHGSVGNNNYFEVDSSSNTIFGTANAERMRLDSSGNLGIGTSSPAVSLHVLTAGGEIRAQTTTTGSGLISFRNANSSVLPLPSVGTGSGDDLRFTAGGSERARIDSSGNLLVGTTSAGGVGVTLYNAANNSNVGRIDINKSLSGSATAMSFRYNGTAVGSIAYTDTATAYNTSSDYRLKEDVQPMTGALAKVAALKPVTYKWNADGSAGEGFIAHELAKVVPQAVTGSKDAVDEDGNPVYQGIDTSFLVATLTAAIQELKAEVDSLKAQLKGA